MKQSRWLLIGFVIALLGALLAGCSDQTTKTSDGQVQLRLWLKPAPGTSQAAVDFYEQRLARFKKKYPHIQVVDQVNPYTYAEFPQRLASIIESGGGPAAFIMVENSMQDFIKSGYVEDLAPHMKSWNLRREVIADLWAAVKSGRKVYGVPTQFYVKVLFYRPDLFKAAGLDPQKGPATWQEMADYAVKLTDRSKNQYGFGVLTGQKMSGWYFQDYVWQAGGEMMVEENGKWRPAFDSPKAARALQFYKDLRWKYNVIQTNVLSQLGDLNNDFATGRLAMLVAPPSSYGGMKDKFGLTSEQVAMAPQPAGPSGLQVNQRSGAAWCVNVNASPEEKEAAWKWIEFIVSKEETIASWKFNEAQDKLTPDISVYNGFSQSDYVKVPASWSQAMSMAMNNSRPEPNAPHYMEVKGLTDTPIQKVLLEKAANPSAELKKAVAEAIRRYYQ